MLDFHESLTLQLPKISMEGFQESKTETGLIVEMAAIHHGLTANFNNYSADELESSVDTWVQPYSKPIILNHDTNEDPIGRVMAARMDKEEDGTPFIRLQTAIFKPEAVARFSDGRYITGSVGGKVNEALCSVCNTNWAAPDAFENGMPCAHERGKVYKGQLAYFNMKGIGWKEYSIVNVPADQRSGVLSIGANTAEAATDTDGDWVKAHFFAVGLNKESLVELAESGERDLLAGKKRKEASPLYHGLRGAYLVAVAESLDDEENEVTLKGTTTEENEDDVLAATDALSADLAADADEDENDEATDAADADEGDAADEGSDENADAEEEDSDEESDAEVVDEDAEDAESDEDADATDQADAADEDEDESDESDEEDDEDSAEKDEEDAEDAEIVADAGDESDERIVALEEEVTRLTEENKRLRVALKRGLAERVVDTKIALGIIESGERQSMLDTHMERTASSLADSLRDLAGMKVTAAPEAPVAEGRGGSVDDGGCTTTTEATEGQQDKEDPVKTIVAGAEDYLTELMLGLKTPTYES